MSECPECCNPQDRPHELWCSHSLPTLTMGELREKLTEAIELDGVHESKSVALAYTLDGQQRYQPLQFNGVQFVRGQFVFVLSGKIE